VKVCFVGKYPPIQGGVSAQTYWAAYGLAERGHDVSVVTNAHEVEEDFRVRLDPTDDLRLATSFPHTGGTLRLYQPEPMGHRMAHIPRSNPHVSKLAGLATDVVRTHGCEVIVGSYFEPYAMSASLAASWTSVPLVVHHAGSDLDRLMDVPELSSAYREMLRSAAAIVTRPSLYARFEAMGIARERLVAGAPYETPAQFRPDAEPLDAEYVQHIAYPASSGRFDSTLPTIGMYGKPGEFKGTFDFIAAAGLLRAQGANFNVLLMCGCSRLEALILAARDAGIADRTLILPFLPHWRVPSFIRTCTAVAFLERDFPVAIHGPVLPREILATGTCLILSGEIHSKQSYRDQLVDGENFLLVPDPKDHRVLADRLHTVVRDPHRAGCIGARGTDTSVRPTNGSAFVDAWERILAVGLGCPPDRQTPDHNHVTTPAPRWLIELEAAVDRDSDLRTVLAEGSDEAPIDVLSASGDPVVVEVVRFLRARQRAASAPTGSQLLRNALGSRPATPLNTEALAPARTVTIWTETFTYDVVSLFCATGRTFDARPMTEPRTVCFARRPNFSSVEFYANPAVLALLAECNGERTTAEVISAVASRVGDGKAQATEAVGEALVRLHRAGYIGFGPPGGGAYELVTASDPVSDSGDRGVPVVSARG
jgi:glycosyltransferase involved in cell wall biosynthesis